MISFKKLLGKIFNVFRNLSKKVYTRGLVIISSGMITVLLLGTNGFIVNSKTNPLQANEKEEQAEQSEETEQADEELNSEQQLEISKSSDVIKEEDDIKTTLQTSMKETISEKEAVIYTEEDYKALVNIVEAEATGEDIIGKIMVANVVLNRVKSNQFPNTIYEVVYQQSNGRAQFSPISDGRMGKVPLTDETYEAVERALKGEDHSNGALFFAARSLSSEKAMSWFDNSLTKVAQHGVHEFYTY